MCREQGHTIRQTWDGEQLMLSFRRNFSPQLMSQWHGLEAISSSVVYQDNPESLIWQYENSGVYYFFSLCNH